MLRRIAASVGLALALLMGAAADADGPAGAAAEPEFGPYFAGQMLVAGPSLQDPRFAQTVIYLAEHDRGGAFGLVVNRPIGRGPLKDFMAGLNLKPDDKVAGDIRLFAGGPVDGAAGFVLHSADYRTEGTALMRGGVAVTANPKVLDDIAHGLGPRRYRVFLGYAGWGPGQLENELRRGDWNVAPYDEGVVFDDAIETKWSRARAAVGVPL